MEVVRKFTDVIAETPDLLLEDIYAKNPLLKDLQGKELTITSHGFSSEQPEVIEMYNRIVSHQGKIRELSQKAQQLFGVKPLAVIQSQDLKKLVMEMPRMLFFENVSSDGFVGCDNGFMGWILKDLQPMNDMANEILSSRGFPEWLKMGDRYGSNNEYRYFLDGSKFLHGTAKEVKLFSNERPFMQRVREFFGNTNNPHESERVKGEFAFDMPLGRWEGNKLLALFLYNLYQANKKKRLEWSDVESHYNTIAQRFVSSALSMPGNERGKIFGDSKTQKIQISFLDCPLRISLLLGKIRTASYQPVVICDQSAVGFQTRTREVVPTHKFDPIVGVTMEEDTYGNWVVILDRFGENLPFEEEMMGQIKTMFTKKFLGEQYLN